MGAASCAESPCCRRTGQQVEVQQSSGAKAPGVDNSFWKEVAKDNPQVAVRHSAGDPNAQKESSVTFEDGSTFTGQFIGSKRHGRGIFKSENEEYTGDWQDDKQHGQGKLKWNDGRTYEGGFNEGHFHGAGIMNWNSEKGVMAYEGQYVNDEKHGKGKFTWANGRIYDGDWLHGLRWGTGAFTNSQHETKVGMWKEDKLERWLDENEIRNLQH